MIGDRIKEARLKLGYSAEQVAAFLDVSPATVYRYENVDISKLPSKFIKPLAEFLCVTPSWLMGWSEDMPPAIPEPVTTCEARIISAGLLWHYAYDLELITRDITQNLYIGKDPTTKREPITEQELEVIRQAIGSVPYAEYVYAQCYLGFRPGEFLALKKSDVTTVRDQLILTGGSKTDAGRDRAVPVPPPIVDIILDRMVTPGTDLLFPRADLKPMSHDYYNKHVFQPMMKKLNIAEGKTPYCARHTYSDMLKNVDADDRVKAALMGHTSYDFTRKAYQSTDIQELIDAANAIK